MTLVELLVALVLALVVVGGLAGLAGPLRLVFQARLEANDVGQRLRAASEGLFADLLMAGAGPDRGVRAGPLHRFFAPVLPFRLGVDPPGTARDDALTIVYVPPTVAESSLTDPLPARSARASVASGPGCPVGDPACGFVAGMHVLVFDDSGAFDLFTVQQVTGAALDLRHDLPDSSRQYAAGSTIVTVAVAIYDLDAGTGAEGPRLMRDDGAGNRLPMIDHVVRLRFEFWADPRLLSAGASTPGRPCASALAADDTAAGSGFVGPASVAAPLVRLSPAQLADGPWCPDASAPNRFDADLLRIRRLRVTIRAEAALDRLRGRDDALFSRGGTGRSAGALVPDRELSFDVAPRNLTAGW